ncbi:hypothetical protein Tco_0538454 [Tanacetum coccineum]
MDGGEDGDDDDGDSSRDDADDEDGDDADRRMRRRRALSSGRLRYYWERLARYTALYVHSSPPPVPSSLLPSSGCLTQIQTLRIASTQALVDAVTAALPSSPLPHYHHLLHPTSCSRYKVGESSTARPTGGRGIDYGFVSTLDAEERRRGIREVGYGIRDAWVDSAEAVPEIAHMTLGEVNTRVTELAELYKHDTQDLYALLEDAQDSRTCISQRVTIDSQRVDLLMGDRMTLQETVLIVEEEAYASREAWAHSIGLSQAVHHELQTHREQVHKTRSQVQQAEMAEAELLALREQRRRARQPAPDTRVPDHQDAFGDADSHT